MSDDIAALIRQLGLGRAPILGSSLGGAVALRTAIHGMDAMGPETAEPLKHSPMYQAYEQIAPNVDDWPVLVLS